MPSKKFDYILFEDHADCFTQLAWFKSALSALQRFETQNPATKVFMWSGIPDIEPINIALEAEIKRMIRKKSLSSRKS